MCHPISVMRGFWHRPLGVLHCLSQVSEYMRTIATLPLVTASLILGHLGHLAVFGPTGSGKTTREEEQLRKWKGSAIVNDPKFQLSHETADIRKQFGNVYFFSPSEGAGDRYDPLDGIESERKIYSLAKHLLYVPNEKEPAFTERATKMLTQLLLTAKLAWKKGGT